MKRLIVFVILTLALVTSIAAYVPYQERKIVASIDEREMMRANIIMVLERIPWTQERRDPTDREKAFILNHIDTNPDFCKLSYDVGIYNDKLTRFSNFLQGQRDVRITCCFEDTMRCRENRTLTTSSIFQNTGRLLEYSSSFLSPCELLIRNDANVQ